MSMFQLTQSPTFWAKVEVEVTAEDGRRTVIDFDLRYKRLLQDDALALSERITAGDGDLRDICREIVVDWRRVGDDDGSTLAWGAENFDKLLNLGFARAIFDTFLAKLPKAKLKN